MVLMNQGNQNFEIKPLPKLTQNTYVKDIAIFKISKDDKIVILAGNDFVTDAEFTLYDGSNGHVLKWNTEQEIFEIIPYSKTGFIADKNVRGIEKIKISNQSHLLIFNNNSNIESFKLENLK
ncbi:MAG: hypothetical protein GVY05_04930 [Bacteroidetes bacterium]|jgi:hypothetical protein|nr:hypothetical protein [Bacteroidota bacterium]